MNIHVALGF